MRRLLPLALLLSCVVSAAAFPPAFDAVLRDLEARVQRYQNAAAAPDPALPGQLQALGAQLDGYQRALPFLDARKTRAVELSAQTALLRERSLREGVRLRELSRDLAAHLAAVRALEPGPGSILYRPGAVPSLAPSLDAGGSRALSILDRDSRSEPFSLRDALNSVTNPAAFLAYAGGGAPPQPRTSLLYRPPLASPVAVPPSPQPGDLASGLRNDPRVSALQNELNVWRRGVGYRVIGVDGDFGPHTMDAVRIFQRDNGLPQTGIADAATAAALTRAAAAYRADTAKYVQYGDRSPQVGHVQQLLNRIIGFRRLTEDDRFGGNTQRAVSAFQSANSIAPSGHVDAETLRALEAAAASKPEPAPSSTARGHLVAPGPTPEVWDSPRWRESVRSLAESSSRRYNLDYHFFLSIIWAEGGAIARLHRGGVAHGPAQITSSAATGSCLDLARAFPARDRVSHILNDYDLNILCGAKILRGHLDDVGPGGSPLVAVSLYNTKARHWREIIRSNKVPAYRETSAYVAKISRIYCQITGQRLLDPNRDLYPRGLEYARVADRRMDDELILEGRETRPDCSPFPRPPSRLERAVSRVAGR
jgi:peptidoglycan hydrolase-like protein with peptidoglycan-binding domain